MRFNEKVILSAGDMSSATLASIGVPMSQMKNFCIQAVFTGSPSGTFKIQVSNDIAIPGDANPGANVVNWTDYTGSSQTISAAGNIAWGASNCAFQWVRLFYTKSSGTGSVTATINLKEN